MLRIVAKSLNVPQEIPESQPEPLKPVRRARRTENDRLIAGDDVQTVEPAHRPRGIAIGGSSQSWCNAGRTIRTASPASRRLESRSLLLTSLVQFVCIGKDDSPLNARRDFHA